MKIAVFCGSSFGRLPEYQQQAKLLGQALAGRNIELIYGGGHVGLMGTIADAVLDAGGRVTGVIPTALKSKEIAHANLSHLIVVKDMHERKATMAELADAFIAMPGGAGTLEEIFEAWTWAMLGYHQKPCAFFNAGGYYDKLLSFIDHMTEEAFLRPGYQEMLIINQNPDALLEAIITYVPPSAKWD